eukprot:XP_001690692.1 predicted protein [Chlamydomonas reinhardtii]
MFRVNFTPAVPKPDTDEPMAAKEEEPCHIAPCWSIILDNTWAHLRPGERAALAETCKDAYSIIRHRLQTHVSLHVSSALAEHLAGQGLTPLKDVMEEEDGPAASNEERGRAACAVLAALGQHAGITACRLDRWDYLPGSAAAALLSCLPSLSSLELSGSYRVDLEALLLAPPPGLAGVTCLRLRELRLSGVQVNDQPSDNDLCAAVGVLTQLTQLELVTFSAATRPGMVALRGIHNETLRGHPLARLPASLSQLTALRILVVGLVSFIATLYMRYGDGPPPAKDFAGMDRVLATLGAAEETKEEGWLALQQMTSLTRHRAFILGDTFAAGTADCRLVSREMRELFDGTVKNVEIHFTQAAIDRWRPSTRSPLAMFPSCTGLTIALGEEAKCSSRVGLILVGAAAQARQRVTRLISAVRSMNIDALRVTEALVAQLPCLEVVEFHGSFDVATDCDNGKWREARSAAIFSTLGACLPRLRRLQLPTSAGLAGVGALAACPQLRELDFCHASGGPMSRTDLFSELAQLHSLEPALGHVIRAVTAAADELQQRIPELVVEHLDLKPFAHSDDVAVLAEALARLARRCERVELWEMVWFPRLLGPADIVALVWRQGVATVLHKLVMQPLASAQRACPHTWQQQPPGPNGPLWFELCNTRQLLCSRKTD